MKIYTTIIEAIDPKDGQLKTYTGQNVFGSSFEDAQKRCDEIGKGYLQVYGEFIQEIE